MWFRSILVLVFLTISSAALAAEAAPVAPAAPAPMTAPMAASMAVDPMTPPAAPMVASMAVAPMDAPAMAVVPASMDPLAAEFSKRTPVVEPMEVKPVAPTPPVEPVASDAQPENWDDPAYGNQSEDPLKPVTTMEATKQEQAKPAPSAPASVSKAQVGDPWWKVLLGGLTNILLLFLSAIATGLGALMIKWISRKAKLSDVEVLAEIEKLYNAAVEMGVNFAEQQAKKLMDDPDAKGKRIEWAVEKIQETIKDLGLAEKSADWIRTRIEAKLGEQNRSKNSVSPPEPPKAAETK
jgi:hypothetical protein